MKQKPEQIYTNMLLLQAEINHICQSYSKCWLWSLVGDGIRHTYAVNLVISTATDN